MMRIDFDGDDTRLLVSDIKVTEDKDGYFTATQTAEGEKMRAVSRDPYVAVAYLLEQVAVKLKTLKGLPI